MCDDVSEFFQSDVGVFASVLWVVDEETVTWLGAVAWTPKHVSFYKNILQCHIPETYKKMAVRVFEFLTLCKFA